MSLTDRGPAPTKRGPRGSLTRPFYRVSELLEASAPRPQLVVWTGLPAFPALVSLRPVPAKVRKWNE